MLTPGDRAPALNIVDQHGATVTLAQYAGRKLCIYFYPKADTPGCTQQSCLLRDLAGHIGDTAIVGISPDPSAKQAKFDTKYSLGFPLLADVDHTVAEAYGVWQQKMNYGKAYMGIVRSAFLVDQTGQLEQVWYKISPKDTPSKLLAALGL